MEPTVEPTPTPTPSDAPAAPANLTATAGPGSGKITLDWDDNTESDLFLYRIFRGTDPDGPYPLPVDIVSPPDSDFVDTGLESGTTYCYVITAEDTDGNESDISNEACAEAP